MKKKLLTSIVIMILLVSFTNVNAQDYPDINRDPYLKDAAGLLSNYDIVQGYPDGTFKPEKAVTRAEMAKIATVSAGWPEYKKNTICTYEDIEGHWAENYIELADALNIVKGISPIIYDPDSLISYNEAYTMILRLLGYNDESLEGIWPHNYYAKAKELNLLKNVETKSEFASRRDISIMLYNALNCNLVKVKSDNTIYDTGKTLLSLIGKKATKELTLRDLKTENFDFTDYLFNKWDVYYDNDEKIVYLTNPRYKEFTGLVTSLMANNLIFATDDYGNVRSFQIPDVPIIINGEKNDYNNLKDSRIRIVYKDDSSKDAVLGVTAYKETDAIIVERKNLYKQGSEVFAGKKLPTENNGEVNYNKLHISGDAKSLEDIKEDDVVYFYETKYSSKADVLTLKVLRKQANGIITDIQSDSDNTSYTINGISYKTGDQFVPTKDPSINDNVKLILDKNNEIVKINITSYGKEPSTFGIVLSSENSKNGNASVRILDEKGALGTYSLADNSSVVTVVESGIDLIKNTNLKKNDIVKFAPVDSGNLKIINYIPSPTYIANSYNAKTSTLSNGYRISSETFIVYESKGKYQLLKPEQLGTNLEGKAAIGYNSHIDALYLSKGIKTEIPAETPKVYNGTIYGIIKDVIRIDNDTSHVQFFNNNNVFSVSNDSMAGKKISSVLNSYVKAEINNGNIKDINKVIPETDKVKITQVYSNQLQIDNITYMEYSPDLKVYVCTTDRSGNITGFNTGSKYNIKPGTTAQLYDLYGGFDGIIDLILMYN